MKQLQEQPYSAEETSELISLLENAIMLHTHYRTVAKQFFVPKFYSKERSEIYQMFLQPKWSEGHFMFGELGVVIGYENSQPALKSLFALAHEDGIRDELSAFKGEGVSPGPWWHYLREQVAGLKVCIQDALQEKDLIERTRDDQKEALVEKKREQYRKRWNLKERGSILASDNEKTPPKF